MKAQNRKEIFLKALANGEEPKIKPLTREEALLKKQAKRESESSGGGEHRCDWNKMDNRPFGEETVKKYIVPEVLLTSIDESYNDVRKSVDIEYFPNEGDEFILNIDGVEYPIILGERWSDGYTDYLDAVSNGTVPYSVQFFYYSGVASCTIRYEIIKEVTASIYKMEKVVTPLDEKFIPDTIARKTDIPAGLDIPTYKKDEITQELIVELAKNRAVFIYEENANGNGNSVWAQRAIITSYNLVPGEDDGCGDITPPKLELCSGFAGALSYEYIDDDIWNEIKAAWGL